MKKVEFSGRTYQLEVEDPLSGESMWPFLQLKETGEIKDAFCSCSSSDEYPLCEHLAMAYYRIYNGHPDPLHLRFQESLWNQLAHLYANTKGYDTELLKKLGPGHYVCESVTGKPLFFVRGKTGKSKEQLREDHRRAGV